MSLPTLINSTRIWLNNRDPGVSEPTPAGYAAIEQWDRWQNTSTGDQFMCTDPTAGALVWLLVSGGGVKTFSPTIVGSTGAGTANYSVQLGNYQKVGKAIIMSLSLQWSGHTGTGAMSIGNLAVLPTTSFIQKSEVHVQNVVLPVLSLSTVAKTNAATGRLDLFGTIAANIDSAIQMSAAGIVNLQMTYFS